MGRVRPAAGGACGIKNTETAARLPDEFWFLTGSESPTHYVAGGSRKGSNGNAVRAHICALNAAAAPATVSGESMANLATGGG